MIKIIFLIPFILLSCNPKKNTENPDLPSLGSTNYIVEAAINAMGSMIDEQTGDNIIASYKPSFMDLLITRSFASGQVCERASSQACSDSNKTLDMNGCVVNDHTYQGIVQLNYSNSSCSFGATGDSVSRVFSTYIYGPHNGITINSSNAYYDYKAHSYGGGTRLSRLSSGDYQLDVLGRHAQVIINNYLAADISMRTNNPVIVTRGLSRDNRQLDGGPLELANNAYQYLATMNFSNIRYAAGCCYPISGTVNVSYTDRRTGSSSVVFTSCGVGTVTDDGVSAEFKMTYCE